MGRRANPLLALTMSFFIPLTKFAFWRSSDEICTFFHDFWTEYAFFLAVLDEISVFREHWQNCRFFCERLMNLISFEDSKFAIFFMSAFLDVQQIFFRKIRSRMTPGSTVHKNLFIIYNSLVYREINKILILDLYKTLKNFPNQSTKDPFAFIMNKYSNIFCAA